MGVILSRFRRKKTTVDVLDKLETKIKTMEQDRLYKEQTRKRIIGLVMAYSVGLYVLFAVIYYFKYIGASQHWLHSVMYASPLLLLPILVILLRSVILWYFNWSLNKNRVNLSKMKDEKKKMLEDIMNTETYKVAKDILDKYGPPDDQSKALKPFQPTLNVPGNASLSPLPATPGQLRQRQLAITSTPLNHNNKQLVPLANSPAAHLQSRLRSDQLPFPLLDKNRSALDKVVDYLLKDGPNHRMALICTQCSSHNGMAIMEEFEYVSYTCAYCGKLNPARKQRPAAPLLSPLKLASPNNHLALNDADDSSLASSASESDDEKSNHVVKNKSGSGCDSDRPPSPMEVSSISDANKKED